MVFVLSSTLTRMKPSDIYIHSEEDYLEFQFHISSGPTKWVQDFRDLSSTLIHTDLTLLSSALSAKVLNIII